MKYILLGLLLLLFLACLGITVASYFKLLERTDSSIRYTYDLQLTRGHLTLTRFENIPESEALLQYDFSVWWPTGACALIAAAQLWYVFHARRRQSARGFEPLPMP